MASKPVKRVLSDTLADLTKDRFDQFCCELRNREEEPRIRRNQVDGKKYWEIADVMVSAFKAPGAVTVAEKILRVIVCNDEADRLVRDTSGSVASVGSRCLDSGRKSLSDLSNVQEGWVLVGFGKYKSKTLQSLYESKDKEHISYVSYLRSKEKTCTPRSKMELAIKYILQCDQAARMTAIATSRPSTSSAHRAASNTRTRKEVVRHTKASARRSSLPARREPKKNRSYMPFRRPFH
ncbi:hypothetical protein LDENG_00241520 [Lucifuga dentata]|nr:hypothetical protein LDENG_00241520 [Lucifuga dentata]